MTPRRSLRQQRVQAQVRAPARRRWSARVRVAVAVAVVVVVAAAAAAAAAILPRPLVQVRAGVLPVLRRERRTPPGTNHSGCRPHKYQTTNLHLPVRFA